MRQLLHTVPDDNNVVPIHFWQKETILKDKKASILWVVV